MRRRSLTRSDLAGNLTELLEGAAPPAVPEFDEWLAIWNRRADTTFGSLLEKVAGEAAADLAHLAELPADDERSTRRYMEVLGCFRPETKGSGTGTVLAALAIATEERDDIQQALPWTINQLGSDTDTIGSFVGGLCGAVHGEDFAQNIWFYELQDHDGISHASRCIGHIANRLHPSRTISVPQHNGAKVQSSLLADRMKADDLAEGQWVFHSILGEGKIETIETHPLRNQPDRQVRLIRVGFENGQSCKFRSFADPGRITR